MKEIGKTVLECAQSSATHGDIWSYSHKKKECQIFTGDLQTEMNYEYDTGYWNCFKGNCGKICKAYLKANS